MAFSADQQKPWPKMSQPIFCPGLGRFQGQDAKGSGSRCRRLWSSKVGDHGGERRFGSVTMMGASTSCDQVTNNNQI